VRFLLKYASSVNENTYDTIRSTPRKTSKSTADSDLVDVMKDSAKKNDKNDKNEKNEKNKKSEKREKSEKSEKNEQDVKSEKSEKENKESESENSESEEEDEIGASEILPFDLNDLRSTTLLSEYQMNHNSDIINEKETVTKSDIW
jgi:cobalamin-dependent methionine synthase I